MFKDLGALVDVFSKIQHLKIDSYLKSLPYFLLTGRKGLYFFKNDTTSLAVAVHPHVENTLIVFPEYDGNGDLTVDVLKKLADKNFNIQLARYTDTDLEKLNEALLRDRTQRIKSISIREESILDWKYPSRIIDTVRVANMDGKDFGKIRNKYNKIANSGEYEINPLSHPDSMKIIQSSIFHWLAGLSFIGKETNADLTEFYETLTKQLTLFPHFFDGFTVKTNKQALGFTIWDNNGENANALAGVNQRSISGMSEFQMVTACKMLADQGIKKYNLGGSETKALDDYKLKFHPIDSISMFTCDVEFNSLPEFNFEMLQISEVPQLQL